MKSKRIISVLLLIALLFVISIGSFANGDESDEGAGAGAKIMTAEQLEEFKQNTPKITNVYLNSQAIERINEENNDSDIQLMSCTNAVADGEEVVVDDISSDATLLSVQDNTYPEYVDNSTLDSFPPIDDQGKIGSCVGWSMGYYQLTNNANKLRNKSGKAAKNQYSPNWIYNLGNDGTDDGMGADDAASILYNLGCPTVSKVPIGTSGYLSWFPETAIWREAIYNKCDIMYENLNPNNEKTFITYSKCSSLDNLKKLLADGYVVTICTYSHTYTTKIGKTSKGENEYVWTSVNCDAGHAMTIVGYDDGFSVDINGDGVIEDAEKGAFKLANSWGTRKSKWWGNNNNSGFIWLAYDALNEVSAVIKNPVSTRKAALQDYSYYYVKPLVEYQPLLIGDLSIGTSDRSQLRLSLGVEDASTNTKIYEKELTQYRYLNEENNRKYGFVAFRNIGGKHNLKGSNYYSTDNIAIDLTSLLSKVSLSEDKEYNFYILLTDKKADNSSSVITKFEVEDMRTNSKYIGELSGETADGSTIKETVQYKSNIKTLLPDSKTVKVTFNNALLNDTILNSNIYVDDLSNNRVGTQITYTSENPKQIEIKKDDNSDWTNNFYKLTVSKNLRTVGGNGLAAEIKKMIYIPFH